MKQIPYIYSCFILIICLLTSMAFAQHHHHSAVDAEVPMTIRFEVLPDPMSGYNLHVIPEDFTFAPELASTDHVPGKGHAHIYINETKIARLYGSWFHLPNSLFKEGDNTVRVTLNSNTHGDYQVNGKVVAAETVVTLLASASQDTYDHNAHSADVTSHDTASDDMKNHHSHDNHAQAEDTHQGHHAHNIVSDDNQHSHDHDMTSDEDQHSHDHDTTSDNDQHSHDHGMDLGDDGNKHHEMTSTSTHDHHAMTTEHDGHKAHDHDTPSSTEHVSHQPINDHKVVAEPLYTPNRFKWAVRAPGMSDAEMSLSITSPSGTQSDPTSGIGFVIQEVPFESGLWTLQGTMNGTSFNLNTQALQAEGDLGSSITMFVVPEAQASQISTIFTYGFAENGENIHKRYALTLEESDTHTLSHTHFIDAYFQGDFEPAANQSNLTFPQAGQHTLTLSVGSGITEDALFMLDVAE